MFDSTSSTFQRLNTLFVPSTVQVDKFESCFQKKQTIFPPALLTALVSSVQCDKFLSNPKTATIVHPFPMSPFVSTTFLSYELSRVDAKGGQVKKKKKWKEKRLLFSLKYSAVRLTKHKAEGITRIKLPRKKYRRFRPTLMVFVWSSAKREILRICLTEIYERHRETGEVG